MRKPQTPRRVQIVKHEDQPPPPNSHHHTENPEARDRALNVEIQNCRGAMLGVFGAMCHSMLDSCDHHFFYPITHN